jgi:crotonobetainyl-CoA:carnitine CoA-transferase CaiB-like acyl-CoA transferase
MPTACEGLRVLEFGWGMPVSLAGMILADNGAEVIKVEPPGGDPLRGQPAFIVWNRGKKSVVLDLKQDDDREKAGMLARSADVVLAAFRPGVAERLGLDYADLAAENPSLIYCAITAFGPDGPYARLPGYDAVVAAKTGWMHEYAALSPEGRPVYPAVPLASYGAAQGALHGVLAALHARAQTGRGQRVEASLVQGLAPVDYFEWMAWQLRRRDPDGFGVAPMTPAPVPVDAPPAVPAAFMVLLAYSKDGRWLQFNNLTAVQFDAFMRALGLELLWAVVRPPGWEAGQYAMNIADEDDRTRLWEAILGRVREKTVDEWTEIFLRDPNIGFDLLRTTEEALDHPQMVHNGQVIALDDPMVGPTRQVGPLADLSETPSRIGTPAPALSQHQCLLAEGGRGRSGDASARSWPPTARVPLPLEGVTVLETAFFFAGPFGTTLLADLGARVIHVEPLEGDPMRLNYPVPHVGPAKTMHGKQSLALDAKTAEGRAILRRLAAGADIFLHNFRPGVAERNGLGFEDLRALNPRLIYLHAAGYGASGPYAPRAMYALTATAINGNVLRLAGGTAPPAGAPLSLAEIKRYSLHLSRANRGEGDATAALAVATVLLLGLVARDRTGRGQKIVSAMIGASAFLNSDENVSYDGKSPPRRPDPALYGLSALYRLYPAREGWVFLAAPREREWPRLCAALGRPAWASDPRFATAEARAAHDAALAASLGCMFAERSAAEWERHFAAHDLACVEVYRDSYSAFANTDPHLREGGFTRTEDHPAFGAHTRHGPVVTLPSAPPVVGGAWLVGQHTRAILGELGYGEVEIRALKATGIVTWPD